MRGWGLGAFLIALVDSWGVVGSRFVLFALVRFFFFWGGGFRNELIEWV